MEIEGDRLALGTNLFSEEETLTENYGLDAVNREIKKKSEFLETLEKIDETEALAARQEYRDENLKFNLKVSNVTEDNTVTVTAYNFLGNGTVERVKLYAWGDNTEKQSYDMVVSGEEFNMDINVSDFLNEDKEYYIQAVLTLDSGEEVKGKTYTMNVR